MDDTRELLDLFGEVSNAAQLRLGQMCQAIEPTLAPFAGKLLAMIGRRPGWSQQRLGAAVQRDKAQVARTVKELEQLGLVLRAASAEDWRSQCLRLTAAGERVFAEIQARRAQLGAEMLAELSGDQRAVLREALELMRGRLSGVEEERS